jgi:hypothetical protein
MNKKDIIVKVKREYREDFERALKKIDDALNRTPST